MDDSLVWEGEGHVFHLYRLRDHGRETKFYDLCYSAGAYLLRHRAPPGVRVLLSRPKRLSCTRTKCPHKQPLRTAQGLIGGALLYRHATLYHLRIYHDPDKAYLSPVARSFPFLRRRRVALLAPGQRPEGRLGLPHPNISQGTT